ILIKDDYSDLEKKLKFFLDRPQKAKLIVENANKYVNQFKDQKKEDLLSFMVLNKYFNKTN
ncbi:MAG: lipopolysaccharide biosynthesis protein, partial [Flavobacteriales bacterium]|nr:lipopolysaccharide biosynthesis protein [Flavobacteriales bacterium]